MLWLPALLLNGRTKISSHPPALGRPQGSSVRASLGGNQAHPGVHLPSDLFIERFCMTGGNSPICYLKAYHTNLYLSSDAEKVSGAIEEGESRVQLGGAGGWGEPGALRGLVPGAIAPMSLSLHQCAARVCLILRPILDAPKSLGFPQKGGFARAPQLCQGKGAGFPRRWLYAKGGLSSGGLFLL